jgi:hypothetical protein
MPDIMCKALALDPLASNGYYIPDPIDTNISYHACGAHMTWNIIGDIVELSSIWRRFVTSLIVSQSVWSNFATCLKNIDNCGCKNGPDCFKQYVVSDDSTKNNGMATLPN